MDFNKVKKYTAQYTIGSDVPFLGWLIGNIRELKKISENENFNAFLVPPKPIPFLYLFDVYDGVPYVLTMHSDFTSGKQIFSLFVDYEEK